MKRYTIRRHTHVSGIKGFGIVLATRISQEGGREGREL